MTLRWHEAASKMFAWGAIKHRVWPAHGPTGFYAKSGMDVHGPYPSAKDAREACRKAELRETDQ
jgi:hypothetical protein